MTPYLNKCLRLTTVHQRLNIGNVAAVFMTSVHQYAIDIVLVNVISEWQSVMVSNFTLKSSTFSVSTWMGDPIILHDFF